MPIVMTTRPSLLLALATGALALAAGCVQSRDPPGIPGQATVSYGPKVFLVDNTVGTTPRDDMCTRLGAVMTGTSTTVTATIAPADGVKNSDGNIKPIDIRVPHNCYAKVTPKELRVDVVEVTNELFQLCVDSGACTTPDPSKASKGQVCSSEDLFDHCPIAETTEGEASNFCKFIGRRLPSGIEHVILREAGATDNQDPTKIPQLPNGKTEADPPATCAAAIVGAAGCSHPQPVTPGAKPEDTKGAAALDVVNATTGQIYDLIGNESEWSSDLLPAIRGLATGMPWFCQAPLPPTAPGQVPTCPVGQHCIYGQYQPEGLPLRSDYPVCIGFTDYHSISGSEGSLFGGSFADNKTDRQHLGTFGRRIEKQPDTQHNKSYGFRCVGDRRPDGSAIDDVVTGQE